MSLKFVILSAVCAITCASYLAPNPNHYVAAPTIISKIANPAVDAVALTHQNVVRSFGGTVAQHSKSVHTPYSSVHKEDTRVNNNVYTPAVAKTVSYVPAPLAATHSVPVVTKTVYAHQQPNHAIHASSAPHIVYVQQQQQSEHAAYASSAPHTVYVQQQQSPHVAYASHTPTAAVFKHHHVVPSAAKTSYSHGPAATTYAHNSPAISAYGSSQTVQYSPADMVSHMSFDGFGTHWGF